ncbi:hypothetical protein ACS127_17265 [Amphibacillus sp. Q70]|uniref:hypothetical protein n=1 Tax=Amphibacillus sp. Q70 TaxID=3453416 RepID=UPI003F833289
MTYLVMVANGEWIDKIQVDGVDTVRIDDGIYCFWDKGGDVIFSSPFESTIFLKQE